MALPPDALRTLDTLRNRLHSLSDSLGLLTRDLTTRDPLPTWPQLSSLQSSLAFTLTQLNETLTQNASMLQSAHVYPLPSFPGHKEGETMMALLRKRLDSGVEGEWIERFTGEYEKEVREGGHGGVFDGEEMAGLWSWASGCSQGIVGPMLEEEVFGDDFTVREREVGVENVRTGLRRKLWEEESGDEMDQDEGDGERMEEDVMPGKKEFEEGVDPELKPLGLENLLRFTTTGAMPVRPNR